MSNDEKSNPGYLWLLFCVIGNIILILMYLSY